MEYKQGVKFGSIMSSTKRSGKKIDKTYREMPFF